MFKSEDTVRISKLNSHFRKGFKPQFTRKVFESVAFSSIKPTLDSMKDKEDEIIRGKLYQKGLIKVI